MKLTNKKRMARVSSRWLGDHFPTAFAKSISESVGLLDWTYMIEQSEYFDKCDTTDDINHAEAEQFEIQFDALQDFQRMAMGCKFEKCLLSYHGFELTEEQIGALRVIHEATPAFLMGRTLDNAVQRMDRDKTSNKDFGAMLEVVINQITLLNGMGPGEAALGGSTDNLRRLVVNVQAELDGSKIAADIEKGEPTTADEGLDV